MSFRDIPTTTATSGMEPFRILFDGFQLSLLADTGWRLYYYLTVFSRWKMLRGVLFECFRSPRWAPGFYNLSDSVIVTLYYILIWSSLVGWYQSMYIYIQICTDWCHLLGGGGAEMECYTYYKFFIIFIVEWICKWS